MVGHSSKKLNQGYGNFVEDSADFFMFVFPLLAFIVSIQESDVNFTKFILRKQCQIKNGRHDPLTSFHLGFSVFLIHDISKKQTFYIGQDLTHLYSWKFKCISTKTITNNSKQKVYLLLSSIYWNIRYTQTIN
jgi:hypothetical protein